ncbi:hypothetical protein GPALN_014662 [Globodera pallida]|nr:hypothetical protein GPALN_014662 [Globodera pallida]
MAGETERVYPPTSTPPQYSEELLQKNVACKCRGGEIVRVRFSLLLQSKTFEELWKCQGLALNELPNDFVFSVESVSSSVFNKVVHWMNHRIGMDDPVVRMDPKTYESVWLTMTEYERNFFKLNEVRLAELLNASNFLCINSLHLYATQALAALLKGKSLDEIRALIRAKDDLSEEQKKEILAKNVWCLY